MQKHNHTLRFSPTDLTRFQASPYDTWMQRMKLEHPDRVPPEDEKDPLMSLLGELGDEHETARVERFRSDGFEVREIDVAVPDQGRQATLSAMREGCEIIAQARLELEPFAGFSDFLVRVPGQSELGDWHYEIWDAKLARSAKPQHLIQLCCYAEMLCADQGVLGERVAVALGTGETVHFRTRDYFASFQALKAAFLAQQTAFDPEQPPDPAQFRDWGKWSDYAKAELISRDHLIQVARITRNQIRKLGLEGIDTMSALADTTHSHIPGIAPPVFQRLKAQAQIQRQSREDGRIAWKLLPPELSSNRGLAALPAACPHDLFFDIEGFPHADGGLEYLFGCTYFDNSDHNLCRRFRAWWGHDRVGEQRAWQGFIDWAYARWRAHPELHIYHYAAYEITALRRLVSRDQTRIQEFDALLRNEVFVDLYAIVRESLLVGAPRYSIKNIEHLYRAARTTDVASGGDSIIEYARWRTAFEQGEDSADINQSPILKGIEDYNRDDCDSTQELAAWLRKRQSESGTVPSAIADIRQARADPKRPERDALRDALYEIAQRIAESHPDYSQVAQILAQLLDYHEREDKPKYWRLHDRHQYSLEQLQEDSACIAACERIDDGLTEPPWRYRFDTAQELKSLGDDWVIADLHDENGYPLQARINRDETEADQGVLALTFRGAPPPLISLVPRETVFSASLTASIHRVASSYHAKTRRLGQSAILDFLARKPPRIKNHLGEIAPAIDPQQKLDQIIRAVLALDSSYLPIQGPPGAGKTYTGARLIAALVRTGHHVGIASNSHAAIHNLLLAAASQCEHLGLRARFAASRELDDTEHAQHIDLVKNNAIRRWMDQRDQAGLPCVVGTTAWGFARPELEGAFHTLFIDEAGQVSLANLVAMGASAANLVLLGDQMQLSQPSEGAHPGDSGLSVLDYLLDNTPAVSPERGVFLGTTFRMHPEVNALISDQVYAGKLNPNPDNESRWLEPLTEGPAILRQPAGIGFLAVPHEGNTQSSEEEAQLIADLAKRMIGRTLHDAHGSRALGWSDMLFVAPYNLQVRTLQHLLGEQARVGTVDRFQGQEAAVVFVSLCASDPSESPRGMSFLLDRHRLNVALSRAQVLAVVTANPAIANARAGSVEQLSLLNFFNAIVQYGTRREDD